MTTLHRAGAARALARLLPNLAGALRGMAPGIAFAVSWAASGQTPAAELATTVVEVATVAREIAFDGTVEAVDRAGVSAQTGGRLLELPYDVGDFVEQGALIASLTDTEQRAHVEAAEAAVAEATARQAEARLAFDRARELSDRKLAPKADLDTAAANLKSARAHTNAARAALEAARQQLGYTVVRAPYAGLVVMRHVQVGETVAPGQLLMTGLSLKRLRVAVDVPQRYVAALRRHHKARAVLSDETSVDAGGIRFPPNADPATQSFRVLVDLPRTDLGVFPGTLVKVVFVAGEREHLLAPRSALIRRGEVTGVYVVREGRVSFRYVRAGTPPYNNQGRRRDRFSLCARGNAGCGRAHSDSFRARCR